MSNIFNVRTFNEEEISKIKQIVEEGVKIKGQIKDLQTGLNDTVKGLCDRMNDGIEDKELKVKASMIKKMINTKFRDNLDDQKENLDELEESLSRIES